MTTTVARTTAILAVTLAGLLANPGRATAIPPHVSTAFPVAQRANISASAVISVNFDDAIDPTTVNEITFRVFGRWSGPASGSYVVTLNNITFTPSEPFFAGEWVTASLSKGIKSMSGEALAKGYAWNFWIKTVGTLLDLEYVGRISTREHNETVHVVRRLRRRPGQRRVGRSDRYQRNNERRAHIHERSRDVQRVLHHRKSGGRRNSQPE